MQGNVTSSIWASLGIRPTDDPRDIKRAYARQLKAIRPDEDPEGFQTLRDAYEAALRHAEHARSTADTGADENGRNDIAAHVMQAQVTEEEPHAAWKPAVAPPTGQEGPPATELNEGADSELQVPPRERAWKIWRDFIADPGPHFAQRLRRVHDSDALHNLDVKEAFEFQALQYCADAEADPDFRAAIVKFFNWEGDASHLFRQYPNIAGEALGRHRGRQMLSQFQHAAQEGDAAVKAILAESAPRMAIALLDQRFTKRMRQLLDAIRWNYPELSVYHLKPEVLQWWADRVYRPRYHAQTALLSLLLGIFLWPLTGWIASKVMPPDAEGAFGASFVAAEVLAFLGVGYLTLRPPQKIIAAWHHIKDVRLHKLRHVYRYDKKVQLGWIPAFALLSLAFFIDRPGDALQWLLIAGFSVTSVFAVYGATLSFRWLAYVLLFGLAPLLAMGMKAGGFMDFDFIVCMLFGLSMLAWLLRGGADFYALLGLPPERLQWLRKGWMAGAALLAVPAFQHYSHWMTLLAAAMWLWCLAGLLLVCIFGAHLYFRLMGILFVKGMVRGALPAIHDDKLASVSFLLAVIAIFMVLNMFATASDNERFA